MTDWIAPAAAVLLALVALGLAVALLRVRSRAEQAVATVRAESAELRERLDRLERDTAAPVPSEREYVITKLGEEEPVERQPAPMVEGRLFADLVVRESVVHAASLAHGVRRALAPATRNRIRFEMRQELKRARKQRKADLREAKRLWADHQRAQEGSAA
jgi:hypothetical protein